jgi:DNA-binding NarL/FixJ family response regulator
MALVALLPEELSEILDGELALPALDPEDERILRLAARGRPVSAIARELGVSMRGAQYRLARLRRRFGAQSTSELAVMAARRGFK